MTERIIIGLTGYAQHGKDTVGQVAVQNFGFQRFAFADVLRSMALTLDPMVPAETWVFDGPFVRYSTYLAEWGYEQAKVRNPEVRRFLQVLGTEAVRDHLGEDAWVEATAKAMKDSGATRCVITDCRFPNEFQFVKTLGTLIRVTRLNEDGTPFDNGLGTDHPSERHIADAPADLDIVCKSGVPVLESVAYNVIEAVLADRG